MNSSVLTKLTVVSEMVRASRSRFARSSLISSTGTASASGSRRATESWRRGLIRICLACARRRLARDDHLAFLQVAFDNFCRGAVSQTNLDSPILRVTIGIQDPYQTGLTGEYWRR